MRICLAGRWGVFASQSCLTLAVWLASNVSVFGQEQPLIVELHEFDPILCKKSFVLVNRSSSPVFGWVYRCVDIFPNGEEVKDTQRGTQLGGPLPEHWPWYPPGKGKSERDDASRRPGPLRPGERYGQTCPCSGRRIKAPADMRVEVLAVLLDGGRGVGDPEEVQRMLRDIEVERSAKKRLLPLLKQVFASGGDAVAAVERERDSLWGYFRAREIKGFREAHFGAGSIEVRHDETDDAATVRVAVTERVPARYFREVSSLLRELSTPGRPADWQKLSIRFRIELTEAWLAAHDW